MSERLQRLKTYIASIPQEPGVYKYFSEDNELIYVGKAKKLKNRVSNYFQESKHLNNKTRSLVRKIDRIEYTLVNSEFDALLLENALIKENLPKYNIQLKDDKSYPYICITNEPYPRLIGTRRFNKIDGDYFGPFSNVKAMNAVMDALRKLYTVRTCQLKMTPDNIKQDKFKICLEYHIGNCLGPCENKQSTLEYQTSIKEIKKILKGNISEAYSYFISKINTYSEQLDFEKAHYYKEKLDLLDKFQHRSVVSNTKSNNLDVFAITEGDDSSFVNYLRITKGTITASKNIRVRHVLGETKSDILLHTIIHTRTELNSIAKEVITNIEIAGELPFNIITPQIGDKKKVLDLAIKNALQYKTELNPKPKETSAQRILKQLQQDLQLKELPDHIECFDNSNIQGSDPVASMVCFKNAKPSKKDYRHYNIKTVIGPNDFDSMIEIVTRRYSRLIKESLPLPKLVIIDGGKGQLSAAQAAVKALGIQHELPMIGIAKRLEEIYFPGDTAPLYISKKSESLKLIQQLRNEAHRFAITFHRTKRSQNQIKSELENIKGLGPQSITALLKAFKSTKQVFVQPTDSITSIVGKHKATLIEKYINEKRES